ncbi:hypothetical protein Dsin_008650 [Dipteronia sinensis]|uniref:Uncharacterized protein n=1 Tax=Dipteronia sinensis TaxID=43782 RepID=A0AAE0AQ02_9ROSI|nr:hypothetical protein Dsin_008650 [Dipteronia sinensis]
MCSVIFQPDVIFVYSIEQISMGYGSIIAHALMSLEARGILFVSPGLEVNSVRAKELNNIRAAGKEKNVKLSHPRLGAFGTGTGLDWTGQDSCSMTCLECMRQDCGLYCYTFGMAGTGQDKRFK